MRQIANARTATSSVTFDKRGYGFSSSLFLYSPTTILFICAAFSIGIFLTMYSLQELKDHFTKVTKIFVFGAWPSGVSILFFHYMIMVAERQHDNDIN